MSRTFKIPASEINVHLPKGAGQFPVMIDAIPDNIVEQIFAHGMRQKLADIAVQLHVRADRKVVKEGDTLFETPDELRAAIRDRALALVKRWNEGEWNLEGSGRSGDPVEGEVWSILFVALRIAVKDRPEARKLGQGELCLRLAEAQGAKRPKGKDAAAAMAVNILGQLRKRAEKIIAERDVTLDVDLGG